MKNKIIKSLLLLPLLAFLALGCKKTVEPQNVVYIANAGDGNSSERVTVAEAGASLDITARAATEVNNNVSISFAVAPDALEKYNSAWGTNYKLLPEKYYNFSSTSAQINAGSAFAAPVKLNIQALESDLSDAERYAIPVSINNSGNSMPVLQSAQTLIVLIDRVVFTTVPYLQNTFIKVDLKTPYSGLKAWTFEWRCNMAGMSSNNRALMMAYGDNTEFYTRFGDVIIKPSQLQVKFGAYGQFSPEQEFQANKWYHFAMVYDGSSAKWYADGKLILNVPLNASFNFNMVQFGNSNTTGMVNEMRFWSVARTPAQITNDMYAVSPNAPGLEGYWKCNEGSGTTFKDATGKGNDMTGTGNITWRTGIRMPAE